MVRIATVNDAEQLNILNDEFNGESETSIDNIRNSLMNNKQEVVIVADEDDMLVGFVCVLESYFRSVGNRFLNGLKKVKIWERNNRCIKVSGMRLKAFLPESGRSGI